jgi:leader peptidase (prepilin peptidase)/N-methyltransferase
VLFSAIDLYQSLPLPVFIMLLSLVAIVGASIGSFLNVVIYRLPIMLERQWKLDAEAYLNIESDQSSKTAAFNLAVPRSACPACAAQIRAWQNIPILSYLFLRGKCYSCKTAISIRYPLIELLASILTVVLFLNFGFQYEFFALLLLTYVSIALTGIDIDHQLLPDNLTLPLVWVGLLINSQLLFVTLDNALWGAVLGYGVLWLVFWIFKFITGKDGMGFGDFKLLAVFGAWFGWQVLPNIILLSSLTGSLVGIWLILMRKQHSQTPMPFGPFIIVAGWLTAIFPQYFIVMNYIR